jgi:predicted lipoprotein with Yx(FWY)xxD motif
MNPIINLLFALGNAKKYMKTSTILSIVVVIVLVLGGVFWFLQSPGPAATAPAQEDTSAQTPGASPTLAISSTSTLGTYLTAQNGMTLYTDSNDLSYATSTCTGACAAAWPPYTVASTSDIVQNPELTGFVGTVTRDDGTLQVTYDGMPLYFYAQDTAAGDIGGEGAGGGAWSVAMP